MAIKKEALVLIVVFLIWLAAVIDPHGDLFGFRYMALLLALLSSFFVFIRRGMRNFTIEYLIYFIFFVVVLPVYGIMVGIIRGGVGVSDFKDTSYLAAGVLFATSMIYSSVQDVDKLIRVIIYPLRILAIIVIFVGLFFVTGILSDFVFFFPAHNAAFIGGREYAGVKFIYIYFVASPMLFSYLVYSIWRIVDRWSFSCFLDLSAAVVAVFISGTRASMMMAFLSFVVVLIWRFRKSASSRKFLLLIAVLGFALIYNYGYVINAFLDHSEGSNSAKISHLNMYGVMFNDYSNILFGQGFGADAWSIDMNGMVKTELTYLEFIRVFGVFLFVVFVLFMIALIMLTVTLPIRFQWLGPAVICNLTISTTNPYLFSTNGMLLLGLVVFFATRKFSHEC